MVDANFFDNWEKTFFFSESYLAETRYFQSWQAAVFLRWAQNTNTFTETEFGDSYIVCSAEGILQFTDSTFLKTFIIYTRSSKCTLKTTDNQLLMKNANNPVRWTFILSLAVPSYTKLENASVGAGTVPIQREEKFAEQPHYGMWRNMQQYQASMPGDSHLSCQIAPTNTTGSHNLNTKKLVRPTQIYAL